MSTAGSTSCVFEEAPVPAPGPGEVRVAVRPPGSTTSTPGCAAACPATSFPLPLIPGCDGAGVVDAVGRRRHDHEGRRARRDRAGPRVRACAAPAPSGRDHLCRAYGIFGETRDGTCAAAVVVPERNVLPMPAKVSFEVAAAFPLVYLTAWHMLVARAELRPGETILVHAAGAGVSTAAIQIAKLLGAGRVIATTSTPEKARQARRRSAPTT